MTGVGAGGTTTVYATAVLGPVKAATAGSLVAAAAPVVAEELQRAPSWPRSRRRPRPPAAPRRSRSRRRSRCKGYKAWACPTPGGDWQPCTKPVKLGSKTAKLKVAVDAGEKVNVVVAKIK